MDFEQIENKLLIDCKNCTKQESQHCEDCVVTFLHKDVESTAIVINLDEYRSIKTIVDSGLVPPLRYSDSRRVF